MQRHRHKHTSNPLAVFAPYPENVTFENQERGEKIKLLLRAHPVTLVPVVINIVILTLIPSVVSFFLSITQTTIFSSFGLLHTLTLLFGWYIFVFGYSFYKFIFWYFNVYILTNERIVDFDFRGILHKETSFANVDQIQDVTPKIIGFFGTLFHFGNVYIQTAAQKPEFEFHNVEAPERVAKQILEEIRLEQSESPGEIK